MIDSEIIFFMIFRLLWLTYLALDIICRVFVNLIILAYVDFVFVALVYFIIISLLNIDIRFIQL